MTMDYRPLGDSGLMVSAVGLGSNAFSRRVDAAGVAAQPAVGSVVITSGQATWSERFERPIQKPSMTWIPGSSGVVAAPSVTNSGV